MKITPKTSIFYMLIVFALGWATLPFSLFNVGRYSFPLILFAGLPFCIRLTYRSISFLVLSIASTIFAISVALIHGIQTSHILSQSALAFLAITFAAGVASVNWHKNMESLERAIVFMGIPIVGYGCYQMAARLAHLPLAFLPVTNKQYYAEGGMQLGFDTPGITRASSVFSEPSELGFYCLWLLVIALSTQDRKIRIASLSLAAAGILVSQSLGAALAAIVISVAYCAVQGMSRALFRQAFLLAVVFGGVILPLKALAPEAFDRFSQRIVEAATFDERADSGRVDHLPACFEIIKASPVWGYGISALASAPDNNGNDATTVNYVMVTMERGLVGGLLFFIPWFALAVRAWLLPRGSHGRTFAFLLMVLTLCSFWDFSLSYFLPFWLAFGVSASLVLQTHAARSTKTSSSFARQYHHASFAN